MSLMRNKKIWSIFLFFVLSFGITHDYIFSTLDTHHSSEVSCNINPTKTLSDLPDDITCKFHGAYHSIHILPNNSHIQIAYQKTLLITTHIKKLFSISIFNFLKPPIFV